VWSTQLIVEHVTRNQNKKTKTNKRQWPLSPVQVKYPWRQSRRNRKDYGRKGLWKRWVL